MQSRSAATVAAILDGASRVLERAGLGGFTTTAVAAAAGTSIGTLYQYFADRDEIAAALSRRSRAALVARVAAAVAACDAAAAAGDFAAAWRMLVAAALAGDRERPRLARAIDQLEARLGLDGEGLAVDDALADQAARWLAVARPDLSEPARHALGGELRAIGAALVDDAVRRDRPIDDALIDRVAAVQLALVARAA